MTAPPEFVVDNGEWKCFKCGGCLAAIKIFYGWDIHLPVICPSLVECAHNTEMVAESMLDPTEIRQ